MADKKKKSSGVFVMIGALLILCVIWAVIANQWQSKMLADNRSDYENYRQLLNGPAPGKLLLIGQETQARKFVVAFENVENANVASAPFHCWELRNARIELAQASQ